MNTICSAAKLKKYNGIIYINKNLNEEIIKNIQSKFKKVPDINKIILIDNSILPKHQDLYKLFDEIYFYERFQRNKIVDFI